MREVKTKGECSLSFLYFYSPRELQLALKCRYISVREKAHRVLFYQVKREQCILEEKPQISLTLILCNLTQTGLAKCRNSPNMPTLKCLFHPCAVGIRHGLCGKVCIMWQPPALTYQRCGRPKSKGKDLNERQRQKCFPPASYELTFSVSFALLL